jgi:hypothetical protein
VDFVIILRELWERRRLVVVAAVVAIAVGGITAFSFGIPPKSRQYEVGIGSARALVDTPSSQVVDLGEREDANAGVLPARATLLATLLTTTPLREKIAARAGVPVERVLANAETPTDGGPATARLAADASLSPDDPRANIITLQTDVSLPLITVNTQAPDARTAAALADGTLSVLQDYLSSVVNDEDVPASRRLVVKPLGVARAATEQRGPSRLLALGITLVIFGLGCVAIVVGSALARDWRSAAALERELHDAFDEPMTAVDGGDAPAKTAERDDDSGPRRRRGPKRMAV